MALTICTMNAMMGTSMTMMDAIQLATLKQAMHVLEEIGRVADQCHEVCGEME